MTPPNTPDEEPGIDRPADRDDRGPADSPPPPQWLSGAEAGMPPFGGTLLPPAPASQVDTDSTQSVEGAPYGSPVPPQAPIPPADPPQVPVPPAEPAAASPALPPPPPYAPAAPAGAEANPAAPQQPAAPLPPPPPWQDPAAALPPFDPRAVFGTPAPPEPRPTDSPSPMQPMQAVPPAPAPPPAPPPPAIEEPWRVTRPPKRTRRRFRPGVLLAVTATLAAASVIAAGVVYLIERNGNGGAGTGGSRLATSIFPAKSAGTDGRAQELTSVATSGSTIVAVGSESDPLNERGQFLVSTDGGRSFSSARMESADGHDPGPREIPRLVAASSAGWIALGERPGGPALWSSSDGRTWRREADRVGQPFDDARVTRIIGTGIGFTAIGATSSKGDFSDAKAALWNSRDGRQWELRRGEDLGLEVDKGSLTMIDVGASGGALFAMGMHRDGDQRLRVAWISTDGGAKWTNAKIPAPKGTIGLTIAGGARGLLAVRDVKRGSTVYGQVYTSADGRSWDEAGKIETPGYQDLIRLVASDQGYTALIRGSRTATLAHSADGKTWTAAGNVPLGRRQTVADLVGAGDRTVVVGTDHSGPDTDALLIAAGRGAAAAPADLTKVGGAVDPDHRVASLGTASGQVIAVGSAGGDATVWSSPDGNTWNAVHTAERPGLQTLVGVTSGGRGWIAVGAEQDQRRHPVVLTSPDGRTWQDAGGNAAFRTDSDRRLVTNDTAAGQSGYVIVGTERADAATWYSADLKSWERGVGADRNDLIAPGGGAHWMRSVVATRTGFVTAGGVEDTSVTRGPRERPAVWTSPNGRTWTRQQLPLPSGVRRGSLSDVETLGNTVVAVGTGFDDRARRVPLGYVSTDGGATWRASGIRAPEGASDVAMTAIVAATGQGFAATGTSGRPGISDVVSWSSKDGVTWTGERAEGTGLSGTGDQQINGLAFHRGTLLGVGRQADQRGQEPTLWRRPAAPSS